MSVTEIDRNRIKKHLRVENNFSDDLISDLLSSAIEEAQNYLNKTWYETQEELDLAIEGGENPERSVLIKESMNQAVALIVEHDYYGPSAMNADKLKVAAYNKLDPDRYIVGW